MRIFFFLRFQKKKKKGHYRSVLHSLLNAVEANEAVAKRKARMAVKCLSTDLKLFESRRESERRRQGDRNRDGGIGGARRGMVGMAGGRGGAAPPLLGKVEGREEVFHHRPGFPPRPLLAISGIHTFARTHISLPALATLNLNLQTRIAPSPSSLTCLYVKREAPVVKIDATFVICGTEAVCFRKRRIIVLYLYFYYYRRQKISKLGHFSNELKRNLRGEEVRLKLNRSKVWLCGIFN